MVFSKSDLPLHYHPLTFSTLDVCHVLNRVNAWKAAGPEEVLGRVLRACALELSGVFAHLFNLSLAQVVVPSIFKTATIVLVPKHSTASAPRVWNIVKVVSHPNYCMFFFHLLPIWQALEELLLLQTQGQFFS